MSLCGRCYQLQYKFVAIKQPPKITATDQYLIFTVLNILVDDKWNKVNNIIVILVTRNTTFNNIMVMW